MEGGRGGPPDETVKVAPPRTLIAAMEGGRGGPPDGADLEGGPTGLPSL